MKKGAGAGTGSATLIMLFSVLCLTVFAVLSLSSANAEFNLSTRYADSVRGYYGADTAATVIYSRLRAADNLEAEAEDIAAEYGAGMITVVPAEGGAGVLYACAIDETLSLTVELRLEGGDWSVKSWELVDTGDWNPDDRIKVWGSE